MYAFDYQQAQDARRRRGRCSRRPAARPLAGGQSLVAAMKLRLAQPGTLVDLAGIPT